MANPTSQLVDERGAPIRLGPLVAAGAEGSVYQSGVNPETLIKIYHPASPEEAQARDRKIRVMLAADSELRNHRLLAWPQTPVLNRNGGVVGFVMRRVTGITLVPLSAPVMMSRDLPHWTQRHVCRVVHDLASTCHLLESRGVCIGDFNLSNFLTSKEDAQTSCIDCDSLQVRARGELFPSRVYTPEFCSPEVLAQPERQRCLGAAQFRFSASLFFFTLLCRGAHAYQVKGGGSPEDNIRAGRFFVGPRGVATAGTSDAIYSRYRALPPRIAALIKRTVMQGHSSDLDARPGFQEWVSALSHYYQLLSGNANQPKSHAPLTQNCR
jgi:DNA-binding helix-hairpin-helix protein with protein kinase domain